MGPLLGRSVSAWAEQHTAENNVCVKTMHIMVLYGLAVKKHFKHNNWTPPRVPEYNIVRLCAHERQACANCAEASMARRVKRFRGLSGSMPARPTTHRMLIK